MYGISREGDMIPSSVTQWCVCSSSINNRASHQAQDPADLLKMTKAPLFSSLLCQDTKLSLEWADKHHWQQRLVEKSAFFPHMESFHVKPGSGWPVTSSLCWWESENGQKGPWHKCDFTQCTLNNNILSALLFLLYSFSCNPVIRISELWPSTLSLNPWIKFQIYSGHTNECVHLSFKRSRSSHGALTLAGGETTLWSQVHERSSPCFTLYSQ